ncbi:MAG: hemolysin family protein [Chitinivibrionia bacterium]|nr:hemolysin family protein [Chitinivibrionia bacterium]
MFPCDLHLLYLVVAAVVDCAYISLLSSTKIVFGQLEHYKNTLSDNRILYIADKVEKILENRTVLSIIISFAKTSAVAVLGILFYFIADIILSEPEYFWWRFLSSALCASIAAGILCYCVPRAFALKYAEKLLMPIYFFYNINRWILAPVGSIMYFTQNSLLKIMKYDGKYKFLSEKEFNKLTENFDSEYGLEKEEKEMIRNIFEFGDTSAKEIMVPRIDVIGISVNSTLKETLDHASVNGHSRIPVYEDSVDSIVGILYVKDLVKWVSENGSSNDKNWSLRKLFREPYYIPAGKPLNDLMEDMKKKRNHIAVVVDEYGGTAGIVTMEDIIEEIVGDIDDEYDEQNSSVTQIDERTFLADPHIELDDLAEKTPVRFDYGEDKGYNTLGGLFYHEHGSVPTEGTELVFKGITLKITKMDAQRIEEIQITIPEAGDNSEIDSRLNADG